MKALHNVRLNERWIEQSVPRVEAQNPLVYGRLLTGNNCRPMVTLTMEFSWKLTPQKAAICVVGKLRADPHVDSLFVTKKQLPFPRQVVQGVRVLL